jgi:3-hydroxybutyrate dehydrogenase
VDDYTLKALAWGCQVNNVGIQYVSPVHTFPEDKWDAIIAVCLSSAFHSTKAALPAMLEAK